MEQMRNQLIIGGCMAATVLALSGCNSTSALPGSHPKQYQQIERLSRPAIKEAFEAFANHDQTNRSAPTNDSVLQNAITTFLGPPASGGVANRSAATANFIVSVLIPDEMKVDLSQSVAGCGPANAPCAAYLGVETGGATGSKFGGRWLNDDTIKTSLGVIFGNTVAALGGAPDDGDESWCLSDDNLSNGEGTFQAYSNTFPYVNTPY
jgi:hypothetical protein